MDTRSAQRDTKQAILLGLAGRCPHCGKGHLFDGGLRSVGSNQEDYA